VTSYSAGITLDLVAAGRDLREADAQRLFHEQHIADPDEASPTIIPPCSQLRQIRGCAARGFVEPWAVTGSNRRPPAC